MKDCEKALERALRNSTDIYVRCDILLIGSITDIRNLVDYGVFTTNVDTPSFMESILTDALHQDWTNLWDEYPDFS